MRFINMYLVGYFILLIGAVAALWYGVSSAMCPPPGSSSGW